MQSQSKSTCVISSEHAARILWEIVGVLFIVYQAFEIPYKFCFDIKDTEQISFFYYLDLSQDIYFITDVAASFNTGYYDESSKQQVLNRKQIIFNYLKSWFVFDLITSFPFSLIIRLTEGEHNTKVS